MHSSPHFLFPCFFVLDFLVFCFNRGFLMYKQAFFQFLLLLWPSAICLRFSCLLLSHTHFFISSLFSLFSLFSLCLSHTLTLLSLSSFFLSAPLHSIFNFDVLNQNIPFNMFPYTPTTFHMQHISPHKIFKQHATKDPNSTKPAPRLWSMLNGAGTARSPSIV